MFNRTCSLGCVCLALIALLAIPAAANDLTGHWEGAIVLQNVELGLKTDFSLQDGDYTGTFDIPQQGALAMPLAEIRCQDGQVHFAIASNLGQADFDGLQDGDLITGTFTQGTVTGTFHLTRGEMLEPAPAPDDGLRHEETTLETATGTLHATLDLPTAGESFDAVLVIPGSGPTDRDGNSQLTAGANNSLKLIGQALAGHGYAALRIDKRGVGASAAATTDETSLLFDNYIEDAAAWIALLQEDPRIGRVAVLGHSEGSLVGMVAAKRAGADAYISVAGAGHPIDETIAGQLAAQGVLNDEIRGIIGELKAGRTVDEVPADMYALFRPSVQPYLISWMRYDPAVNIVELDSPVLILQGDRDLQITVDDAERLYAGRPDARLEIIPTMNHVLKSVDDTPAANYSAYGDPSLPLAPGFTDVLMDFLAQALVDGKP